VGALFSFEFLFPSFSKGFRANPGNVSTNRKKGIALPVLKSFGGIQKL
jgi:hypothetical protein